MAISKHRSQDRILAYLRRCAHPKSAADVAKACGPSPTTDPTWARKLLKELADAGLVEKTFRPTGRRPLTLYRTV